MKITPMDIKNQDFKKVMRGYDPVEVNTFLEMLSNEVERLIRDHKANNERIKEMEAQIKEYKQIEKSLQQALLQAQETASQARQQSQKEAEIVIKQAEAQANEIVHDARSSLSQLHNEIEQFKTVRETMVSRLKILLQSQLELIRSLEEENIDDTDYNQKVTVGEKTVDVEGLVDKMDKEQE